ncbi:MAG TPA: hypothetical protein VG204_14110 [Terriglobia bacterium]|nr:hypothetical protein [Terriglobia bacterium]
MVGSVKRLRLGLIVAVAVTVFSNFASTLYAQTVCAPNNPCICTECCTSFQTLQ